MVHGLLSIAYGASDSIVYGGDGDETAAVDIQLPARVTSSVGVFLVHGGSWYRGSRQMYHPHLARFAATGRVCASAGYRLDPGSRLRDKMSDVAAGYQVFRDYLREHCPSVRSTVLVGGSAGAHLAALLALRGPEGWNDRAMPFGGDPPAGCVCWYGPGSLRHWPDMDERIRAAMEQLCGAAYDQPGSAEVFARASPETYVGDHPPDFLFLLAEHEDLFPHRQVHELADRLRGAGADADVAVVAGTRHGFMMAVDADPARYGFARMRRFLDRYEADAGTPPGSGSTALTGPCGPYPADSAGT